MTYPRLTPGAATHRDGPAWQEKREIARRLLAQGVSRPAIAAQLCVSRSWLKRLAQEMEEER